MRRRGKPCCSSCEPRSSARAGRRNVRCVGGAAFVLRSRRCPQSMKLSHHLSPQNHISDSIALQPSLKRFVLFVKVEDRLRRGKKTHLFINAYIRFFFVCSRVHAVTFMCWCVCLGAGFSFAPLRQQERFGIRFQVHFSPFLLRCFHTFVHPSETLLDT